MCLGKTVNFMHAITIGSVALAVLSPPTHSDQQMVTQTQSSLLLQAISHFNKTHNIN